MHLYAEFTLIHLREAKNPQAIHLESLLKSKKNWSILIHLLDQDSFKHIYIDSV